MRRKLPFLGLLSVLLVSMGCQMNNQDPSDSAPTAPAPKAALLGADISAGGVSAGVSVGLSVPSVVPTAVPPLFPTNTPTPTNSFTPTRTVTPTNTATATFTFTPTATFTSTSTPTATSIIPDPNLRQAVMEILETATPNATVTLNAASLASLKTLVADNNSVPGRLYPGWVSMGGPVTSLQGLQNCVNLQTLYLESNVITDLNPLAPLASSGHLQFLDLDYNDQLSDLSPLSGISSLSGLELRSGAAEGDQYYAGALSDLGPVSKLVNLDMLEFSAQPIKSLAPLASLGKLTRLYMIGLNGNNGPADGSVAAFQGLTGLQALYAQYNKISDISSLAGLSRLQVIDLGNNSITDISPLAGLGNVTTLHLQYNRISGVLPTLDGLGNQATPLDLVLSDNTDISGNTINNINSLQKAAGLKDASSVLNITHETGITQDQISALQGADPQLTIVGP